jgi:hypothetical protein
VQKEKLVYKNSITYIYKGMENVYGFRPVTGAKPLWIINPKLESKFVFISKGNKNLVQDSTNSVWYLTNPVLNGHKRTMSSTRTSHIQILTIAQQSGTAYKLGPASINVVQQNLWQLRIPALVTSRISFTISTVSSAAKQSSIFLFEFVSRYIAIDITSFGTRFEIFQKT